MNNYILATIETAKIASKVLCKDDNADIKGIICLSEKIGTSATPEFYNYSNFCKEYGISCVVVSSYNLKNSDDILIIKELNIDILFVLGWQRLVPENIIDLCNIGVIGAHGSSEGITRGRGRSPQNWALILGKRIFEVSIFWFQKGIDDGDIIDTRKYDLTDTDDIMSSYIKIQLLISEMILINLRKGLLINRRGKKQDNEQALFFPKRIPEDGMIDWNLSCQDIYNFVRGQTHPYPGAYTIVDGESVHIWKCIPVNIDSIIEHKTGKVCLVINSQFLVRCKMGYLLVQDYDSKIAIKEDMEFETSNFKSQMQSIVERHINDKGLPLAEVIMNTLK